MSPKDAITHLRAAGCEDPHVYRNVVPQGAAWIIGWRVLSGVREVGSGRTLREALASAGYPLPAPSQYVSDGLAVKLGTMAVATAKSATYATRIARALNSYRPGPKGY